MNHILEKHLAYLLFYNPAHFTTNSYHPLFHQISPNRKWHNIYLE